MVRGPFGDGQHWDIGDLTLPQGTAKVVARLMYQSVSWKYLKFPVEENRTDDWSDKLYDAWTRTERCPPQVMAEIARDVKN